MRARERDRERGGLRGEGFGRYARERVVEDEGWRPRRSDAKLDFAAAEVAPARFFLLYE